MTQEKKSRPPPPPRKVQDPAARHRQGHRQRLRQRFARAGAGALHDYELLELVLFNALPRRDTKPLAKDLLARLETFAGVITAPRSRLQGIPGLGSQGQDRLLMEFAIVRAAAASMARAQVAGKTVLSSWDALLDYLRITMSYEEVEQFRILFLNRKNALIVDEVQQKGTVDSASVYPREVARRALDLGATSMVLAHNHPSGDPSPSRSDIEMTQRLAASFEPLGITIHDHLIMSRGSHASFKEMGLL